MVAAMNDMAAPSVSLEGRNLWLAQSLPILPWQALRAKLSVQLALTGIPALFCCVCLQIVCPASPVERVLLMLVPLLYVLLSALFGLFLGVKMPNLTWTNELVPIKQSASVMIALLVALQWATKPLGQFVTGSCVNLVLGVSVLVGGLWCGLTVALVSPFFAFLLGIGPAFLPIVPMVAVGNMVLVVILHLLASRDKIAARSYLAVAVGAVTKFLALWLLIVKLVLPTLGLAEKQVAAISASFSWPQLVTAAIGGVLAVTIAPLIRKALRSK